MSQTTKRRTRYRGLVSRVVGQSAATRASEAFDDGRLFVSYLTDAQGRKSLMRLRGYKDRYRGKRAFIIGNGPSLAKMDLSVLRGQYTFGLNRLYLKFEDLGFPTTFLLASEQHVIEQFGDGMMGSGSTVMLSHRFARDRVPDADPVLFLSRRSRTFGTDPLFWGFFDGNTVTYSAMQIAFYMGFSEVVLIGVDHSFQFTGEPDTVVVSTGNDPNHFDPSYFGAGIKWVLPNLPGSERAYAMAREHYESHGRKIVDATIDGKLQVFPKVSWDAIRESLAPSVA